MHPVVIKTLPLLLGVSLAANAAWLWQSARSGGEGSAEASLVVNGGAARGASGSPSRAPEGPATGESAAIAAALQAGDLARLRDELRVAGVEEDLVRAIVGTRLWKNYEARFKALQPQPDPEGAWWKNDEDRGWGGMSREQREEMRALQREQKAEVERLLGPDPRAEQQNPWLARQYSFVDESKREDLQQLEGDYNELMHELRRESRGFSLPADQEKLRFLAEEKRRDLAALLTPAELEAYELRQSRTAQNLRWRATQMDATEDEFRALFEIQRDFDERYSDYDEFGNRTRSSDAEERKARQEAEKAMKARIREALGPERYAAYLRSQDGDYQQLRNATRRFELPADTPDRIYALRDEVPRAAARIADDESLSVEQKREAVKRLAEETRGRVSGVLGPDVAQVYFDNNGMQWLTQLENGTIITFDEEGGQTHRRVDQISRPKQK